MGGWKECIAHNSSRRCLALGGPCDLFSLGRSREGNLWRACDDMEKGQIRNLIVILNYSLKTISSYYSAF